jgi:hypothetical protein
MATAPSSDIWRGTSTSNKIITLAYKFGKGEIDGKHLAKLVDDKNITKSERRKIGKLALAEKRQTEKKESLTPRQILRQSVKEKKSKPKLTKDDRRKKYLEDKLDEEREINKAQFETCLGCRKKGHILKFCPESNTKTKLICFNCGSTDHPLRNCTAPKKNNELPFAHCFICKQSGNIEINDLFFLL